jgi:hypothetical protein
MKLNDTARQLIGSNPATLVTTNRDGSPQVSVVWVTAQTTTDGGDELVTAHLAEHLKIRNIRRDPRVAVTIVSTDRSGPRHPICRSRARRASSRAALPNCSTRSPRLSSAPAPDSRRPTHRPDT